MQTQFHIGIDDTDSRFGGCTTYTAALIFEKILERNISPIDFPWLVRLNPNIPWKTRGNGALGIHLRVNQHEIGAVRGLVIDTVRSTSDPTIPATDPSAVFLQGPVPEELQRFSSKALHDVIRINEAERLLRDSGAEAFTFKGRRGIIGALAALGYPPDWDHTYEIIAYRTKEYLGKRRRVNPESIKRMDQRRELRTFNNLDPETGRILVCPHGPDPVLLGIRGEDPAALLEALQEVSIGEPVERVMLFKTNQGTDVHLVHEENIGKVAPHQSVVIAGRVLTRPTTIRGGHVVFKLRDPTGSIDCAAYEPTGPFRKAVRKLLPGDTIRALGGVRRGPGSGLTLNLEKLEVLKLVEDVKHAKPFCPACGSSSESMGRLQGFRCRRCGLRLPRSSLISRVNARGLKEGVYLPPARAHRHLTKPESRYSEHSALTHPWAPFHGWDSVRSLLESNLCSKIEN